MASDLFLQNNPAFFAWFKMFQTLSSNWGWRYILIQFNSSHVHWVPAVCPVVDVLKGRRDKTQDFQSGGVYGFSEEIKRHKQIAWSVILIL